MTFREGYTYGDVLIQPAYSDIPTRADIDVRTMYLGEWRLPIISAPMDTVTGPQMAVAMHQQGGYGILHRFSPNSDEFYSQISSTHSLGNGLAQFGAAIGVKQDYWLSLVADKVHSLCIDVAHGHHQLVIDMIKFLHDWRTKNGKSFYIIAGNVATGQGYVDLAEAGADAIRVGIGPGSACTTRETTGVGVPQLTALQNCVTMKDHKGLSASIIADGGIQNPGDIAKALAAGADAVMLGKMLAGADESLAEVHPVSSLKVYRGQSTVGSNGARGAPEGITGTVLRSGPVADTLEQLMHYLRSSMSYVGANNLQEFREKAKFIHVSPATFAESATRLGEY